MTDLIEDLSNLFFLAQQRMSLYQASPEALAAAPQAFALHRLNPCGKSPVCHPSCIVLLRLMA